MRGLLIGGNTLMSLGDAFHCGCFDRTVDVSSGSKQV